MFRARAVARRWAWGAGLTAVLLLCGCGQFFPPISTSSSSGSGSGSTTNTGDYLYVANSASGMDTIAGFTLANSKLAATSGTTYTVPLSPFALAVTPSNSFLYVGSEAGAIYVYTINSDGSLSIGNGGNPVATSVFPLTMKVDTTGNWLIAVDSISQDAYVFRINTSTGALTSVTGSTVGLAASSTEGMALTPDDSYVYVALGTGGVETLSFNSSTGALAEVNNVVAPKQNLDADQAVAVSPNGDYLFVAETGISAVRVYSIGSGGAIKEIAGSPFSVGLGPDAILVDSTSSYVYVANRTANTISAFTLATDGTLTKISGSPFAAGTNPVGLVEDNSDTYVAAVNEGGSPDLKVYTISTTTPGALTAFSTSATGTDPTDAISIAATN